MGRRLSNEKWPSKLLEAGKVKGKFEQPAAENGHGPYDRVIGPVSAPPNFAVGASKDCLRVRTQVQRIADLQAVISSGAAVSLYKYTPMFRTAPRFLQIIPQHPVFSAGRHSP